MSARYRRPAYGANHPLAIPRVPLTHDLICTYDALTPGETLEARQATLDELAWFHTPEYIDALAGAEARGRVAPQERERFALGTLENPYFDQCFTTPATAAGASIQAAEALLAGRRAFNPAGGMHHARPDRAQGFCYINDVALGILRLRRAGLRVLYVDIDAHHGDGVEAAFRDDPGVLTLSLHMDTAYAYPHHGGRFEDAGSTASGFTTVNVPLPAGVNDAEYRAAFEAVWDPVRERFGADAVVLQAGADALALDPLGKWCLTTQGFLAVVARVAASSPRVMATGGGGYHPIAVARAWTGVWALLSGRDLPAELPDAGARCLQAVHWALDEDEPDRAQLFRSRFDRPGPATVRPEILGLAARVREHPFLR